MQIMIEIPEEIITDIKDYCGMSIADAKKALPIILNAIHNGTPLPKGHGRLIDYGYVVDAIDDWINAEEYNYTNATDYLRNRIRNVPTIIEADTESEE